jgi:hypothetical protein
MHNKTSNACSRFLPKAPPTFALLPTATKKNGARTIFTTVEIDKSSPFRHDRLNVRGA